MTLAKIGGRYSLDEIVARGSLGVVYRGIDGESGASVAIKKLQAPSGTQIRGLAGREMAGMRRLRHAAVVKPIARVDDGEHTWIVTEWIDGRDLGRNWPPFGAVTTAALAAQGFATLAAIHEAGVVHRDVKPSNLILTPKGVLRWIDFGVSYVPDLSTGETKAGTTRYLDPRVMAGKSPDKASDVYALSVTILERHLGKTLWPAWDPLRLYRHVTDILKNRAEDLAPSLPPNLADVLVAGLKSALGTDRDGEPFDAIKASRTFSTFFREMTTLGEEGRLAEAYRKGDFGDSPDERQNLGEQARRCLQSPDVSPRDKARWMAYQRTLSGGPCTDADVDGEGK